MSAAGAIRAGAAYVELFTKDNLLTSGLQKAEARIRAFGAGIASIGVKLGLLGAAVFTPIFEASKAFAESGSALLLMSQRTGIAVEDLSGLAYAAERSGVSMEDFETGIKKMNKEVQKAADGGQEAIVALHGLGITVEDLAELSVDERFVRLAEGLSKIADRGSQAARTMEIFGARTGTALLPMIQEGNDGIVRLVAEAEKLGFIKTTEQVQSARALQLAYELAARSVKSAWNAIGGAIAPLLTDMYQHVLPFIAETRKWISENKSLFSMILIVAGAVTFLGSALVSVGMGIKLASYALTPLVAIVGTVFSLLGTVWGLIVSAIGMLLTPFGFLMGALALLGGRMVWVAASSAGTFGTLRDGFLAVGEVAATTWGGISAAIAAGDWGLAAEVGWAGLKAAFATGLAYLQVAWNNFSGWFVDGWADISGQIEDIWGVMCGLLSTMFAVAMDAVNAAIRGVQSVLLSVSDSVRLYMASLTGDGQATIDIMQEIANRPAVAAPGSLADQVAQQVAQEQAQRENDRADAQRQREWDRADGNAETMLGADAPTAELGNLRGRAGTARNEREIYDQLMAALAEHNPTDGIDQSRAKADVKGTFSAVAAGGLGASSVTERIADGITQLVENTANLPNLQMPPVLT